MKVAYGIQFPSLTINAFSMIVSKTTPFFLARNAVFLYVSISKRCTLGDKKYLQ